MKHLLLILISLLLLSSPAIGQSSKYESVNQCVLQTMTEKKLTGNKMFEMVKEECERILGKVEEEGVLYEREVNGEWGWYKSGNEKTDDKYVGEIEDGVQNGQGTRTSPVQTRPNGRKYGGDKYVGEFKDGKEHGQGTLTWSDGTKWVGEFKNGQIIKGTRTENDGSKYVGGMDYGFPHGQGRQTSPDGWEYIGEYDMGMYHGQGTLTTSDGSKYVGEFKGGSRHGQGTETWSDGTKYVGEFKKDTIIKGTRYSIGDGKYVGEFKDMGMWNGIYYDKDGNIFVRYVNGEVQR